MRRILVDHARRRNADKRGGGAWTVPLEELQEGGPLDDADVDVVALDLALVRLSELDPRQSRIVELRFFGGLSNEEAAEVVGLAPRTVKLEWTKARAWLFNQLRGA
jgi:RNA polymerase sigma factor (TIGR02999 family)